MNESVLLPAAAETLGREASRQQIPMYLVGGAVRSLLLGQPAADYDICGPFLPERVGEMAGGNISVTDAVNGLGTAVLLLREAHEPRVRFEYTAFRTEQYAGDGSHTPVSVSFTAQMEADAARRDFTINALYADLADGRVLDPLGRGRVDLEEGLIRMTHSAAFREDALRILRMIRFAAQLGFRIDPETMDEARRAVPGLGKIAPERTGRELTGILMADVPYGKRDAVERGLFLLKDLGVLEKILPELMEGSGFSQRPEYHAYDVLNHALHSCAAAPPDLVTRFAALLHDVSKPEAFRADGHMHRHPELGAQKTRNILRRFALGRTLETQTGELVRNHMFDLDNTAKEQAVARRILGLGPEQFSRLIDLRLADFAGSGRDHDPASARKWRELMDRMLQSGAPLSTSDLAVAGADLIRELGRSPGPWVNELLQKLLIYASLRPSRNEYKRLIKHARMIAGRNPEVRSRPYPKRQPSEGQ